MTIRQQIQFFSNLFKPVFYEAESFEERLKKAIQATTGVNKNLLNSKTRKREIVQARQLFHTFMRDNTKLPLTEIGNLTGGHDHATCLHSYKTINNLLENNKEIQQYYNKISELII